MSTVSINVIESADFFNIIYSNINVSHHGYQTYIPTIGLAGLFDFYNSNDQCRIGLATVSEK